MRIIGGKHRGAKLYTLEGIDTRPTLDRVKEPLFSIIQQKVPDATVLDLFAGSGALGLEAMSRGAKIAVLCDQSAKAIHIIEQNVDKLKEKSNVSLMRQHYEKALEILKQEKRKFDIVFLDPPYRTDFASKSAQKMVQYELLNQDGIIIVETDCKEEVKAKINELGCLDIYDERKYGRANLIFMKQKI